MFSIAEPDFIQTRLYEHVASLANILSLLDLRLIFRRRIVAFLLDFLLRLLRFIVFIKYFEIFHIVPDTKVSDRPQQNEEGCREV